MPMNTYFYTTVASHSGNKEKLLRRKAKLDYRKGSSVP